MGQVEDGTTRDARRVRWGDVEIDARSYPASTMTITLFTVSLERTWWVL